MHESAVQQHGASVYRLQSEVRQHGTTMFHESVSMAIPVLSSWCWQHCTKQWCQSLQHRISLAAHIASTHWICVPSRIGCFAGAKKEHYRQLLCLRADQEGCRMHQARHLPGPW